MSCKICFSFIAFRAIANFQVTFSWVKKIFDLLIINLDKADSQGELDIFWMLRNLLEETRDHPRNDTSLLFNIKETRHGMGLSRSSLTISEDCSIIAI